MKDRGINKDHNNRYKEKKSNPRFRLKPDEADVLLQYRRIKEEAQQEGLNPNDIHSGWIKSKTASLYFKNQSFRTRDLKQFKEDLIKELQDYAPDFKYIEKPKVKDGHCLLISPADVHIGKLCKSFASGEEYNKQKAVIRTMEGVQGCLDKSRGFNIDKIVLVIGNDCMHIDSFSNKTTKGTLPRPTFSVANANNAITNLMVLYSPLNAELKRIQTCKKFLDAVNFSSGTNATADPAAIFQTDYIWYIDRVAAETPELVTFELTGKINMQNLRLPKRQVVEHCPWEYKGTECGYNGSKCFNVKDEELFGDDKQTLDKCGHKYSSCLVRFKGQKIPFGGFLSARLQM